MTSLLEYFNCASCACQCQPCCASPPGFLCQPYHLPGYGGHLPTMKCRFGGTFGKLSKDVLQDPCACAAPCPVLMPDQCIRNPPVYSCCAHGEERFCMKGCLAPRCEMTDVYRNCEYINESYSGHVPGFTCRCVDSNQGRSVLNTKIFINNAGFYNQKIPYRNTSISEV